MSKKSAAAAKKIRVGIIGCGSIGQIMHLPHVSQMTDTFELAGICDISPGVLEHCGQRFHVPPDRRFTTVQSLLEKGQPEAVIVCDLLHSDPTIAALKAGCHVLCEKPMAHSLPECDEMLNVHAKSGKTLMIGYMKRYDPGYEYAQARVRKLNDVFHVRAHDFVGPNSSFTADIHDVKVFNDVKDNTTRKLIDQRMESATGANSAATKYCYGMLLYLCTHDLTIMRGMFNSPRAVKSALFSEKGKVFNALLDYGDGMTGVFEWAEFALKKFDEELSIYSKTEVIKVQFPSPFIPFAMTEVEVWSPEGPGKAERPDRPDLPDGPAGQGFMVSKVHASYDEAFRRELQHFAHCVRTGEKPRTTPEEGREDIRLCIEMYKKAMG